MGKSTPENEVKDAVKAILKEVCKRRGLAYRVDWHAGSEFETTLDATGVVAGHPFILEAKRMDEPTALTPRQKIVAQRFRDAGAKVHDVTDPTSLMYLRHWLETLEPREPHDP